MRKSALLTAGVASVALAVGFGSASADAAERPLSEQSSAIQEGSASADRRQARNGTEYVGGGLWTYGVWDGRVHSAYGHERSTHRASVKSSGVVARSDWMPPTRVASVSRPKALFGNQAYWATRG